ncbi:unnamed protein product [Fusarium graminearum]|uniref:Chromosome 4, complete genome n=1 Tax=Gibberella zeae (strain ATCC MYA-4620 / CBS 123657 / FGSC 9075 / NRRL 31084 / PH-1) TaxID=229533 RepID=A0A0E0S943_GIBZE|nr:hypothetical protein FG05_35152 [Fusarium graminearum]CEF82956.1 unnamed protein product [Fusarium graminearum]
MFKPAAITILEQIGVVQWGMTVVPNEIHAVTVYKCRDYESMPGQVTAHTPLKDHRKWIAQECFIPGEVPI